MNYLRAENLAIKFKNRIAVKDVSIKIKGEIVEPAPAPTPERPRPRPVMIPGSFVILVFGE